MRTPDWRPALQVAHDAALDWLEHPSERPIRPERSYQAMLDVFSGPVPDVGEASERVVASLAEAARPGLMAMNHARFFGWVIGGAMPAGVATDWLVAAWDQNTAGSVPTPAMSAMEATTAGWLLELLDLPRSASVGFVTGGQMANLVCLAAARERVLADAGWDVAANGLIGAPAVTVLVGDYVHHTVGKALRILGLGEGRAVRVATDPRARMRPDALRSALAAVNGPTIVCAQGGEVNTGSVDPIAEIADVVAEHRRANPADACVANAGGARCSSDPSRLPALPH